MEYITRSDMSLSYNFEIYPPGSAIKPEEKDIPSLISQGHISEAVKKVQEAETEEAPEPCDDLRRGPGRWNFNRKKISRKGIDALNEMILEEDPAMDPFEDKKEALDFMTQDFE
jgi:hypothetical protein